MVTVIACRDLDGGLHLINMWPATGPDLTLYEEEAPHGESNESRPGGKVARRVGGYPRIPLPSHTVVTRPNRTKVYSVRLSADEQAEVEAAAQTRHLPASKLVRSWILDRLEHEKSA